MNRIYQGRVTRVEVPKAGSKGEWVELPDGEQMLWNHHALFQDAVNYYVVCLLALAQPGNALYPIREKLDAPEMDGSPDERMVWRPFRRRGALRRGMRDSVAPFLCPDKQDATPADCFQAILRGNDSAKSAEGQKQLDAGLTQLLAKCTGASGCRNAAPEFLPRFCSPDFKGNYVADSSALSRKREAERLPFVLHDANTAPQSASLDAFGVHSIALPNAKKPKLTGTEAITKLEEMVAEWRKRQPDSAPDWDRLRSIIGNLPSAIELPGYAATSAKNEVKFRLFAMFLFRYVERSDFTLGLLRSTTRKPDADERLPDVQTIAEGDGDPIRLSRGARGHVFRAFTSLPCWGGDNSGTALWVPFDVAAFEEALKALHQVSDKKKQRDEERALKQARLKYQRGETKKWKGESGGEDEHHPPVLAGDPRIARLEKLVDEDLKDEYEMSEGVSVKYGLHPRTIRGFRDLRKKWQGEMDNGKSSDGKLGERLLTALRDYQKDNPTTIGSVRLFEELLKEENHLIWCEPTAEQMKEWRAQAKLPEEAEFATDPLQALTDERELKEEIDRLAGPIRFTPADPEHSRRQFYFSDATALDKKGRLRHDRQVVETEVALMADGKWQKRFVQIHFSAPRLLRDQLNNTGGKDAAFQQSMMAALGLKAGLRKTEKGKVREARFEECTAVALMPEVLPDGGKRILLNFPIKLEDDAIARQLGKAARWDALQFGGADGESYWLRWPRTWIDEKKERKKAPPAPWWKSPESFRALAVDLGQRDAGAYALLEASSGEPLKKQSRKLGEAEGRTWWATLRAIGLLRLPGEDALVMRGEKWQEEFSGERGRNLVAGEWEEAQGICARLEVEAKTFLGEDRTRYSFPELNDRLLFALRRAQSRFARLQSWSCLLSNDKRKAAIIKQLQAAVAELADKEESGERDALLMELKPLVEKESWKTVEGRLIAEVEKLRASIPRELERIANRIQPLRGRRWEWALRPDNQNHFLRQTVRGTDDKQKLLAGQRGLSIERIEQLESLRQRCQSLNRALRQTPGVPANLGKSKRGIELPDPCPELLDRLEALKEQRVNQTAHLILAQALGVRLRAHTTDPATRAAQDTHGEYERIPGREPVDFLVLENLDRYLASQGRSRNENSRLMKWCHRQILGKLKQLCEPYGLRVLETPAAYSSRFCSLSGVAGFRAVELTPDDAQDFRWRKHFDRLEAEAKKERRLKDNEREESLRVKALFDSLNKLNADLLANRPARPKWRTLLAPMTGGPIFIPMTGKPMQADINAAINLGLRALAAPENGEIHVRIRSNREGDKFYVRAGNVREKARWKEGTPEIVVADQSSREALLKEAHPNFFADIGQVATFDRAKVEGFVSVASGRGLWGSINQKDWVRAAKLNNDRLHNAKHGRPLKEEDNVPM